MAVKHLTWTNKEKHATARRAVELLRDGKGYTKRDALEEAQKSVIEIHRMKVPLPYALYQSLCKRIDELGSMGFTATPTPAAEVVATPPTAPPPTAVPPALLDMAQQIGAAIAKGFMAEAQPLLALLGKPMLVPVVTAPAASGNGNGNGNGGEHSELPPKLVKHKVTIVGFPEPFRHSLAQHFPHLDMRFFNGDANSSTIRASCDHSAWTFVMIKGGGHNMERGLKGANFTRVNGSQSDLKRLLTARFPRTTAMTAPEVAAHH